MKRSISRLCFFLLFLISASAIQAQEKVIYDGNVVPRDVTSFRSIQVSGSVNVYISQSTDYALAVSAPGSTGQKQVRTTVSDGVLIISGGGGKSVRVYVGVADVDKISASGGCNVYLVGKIKADRLKIELTGASDLKGGVEVEELSLRQSGSSDTYLNGSATSLKINLSGASDCKSYGLITEECVIDASGASDVQITVNKAISADVSGACDINYKGDAKEREIKKSGASTVYRRS